MRLLLVALLLTVAWASASVSAVPAQLSSNATCVAAGITDDALALLRSSVPLPNSCKVHGAANEAMAATSPPHTLTRAPCTALVL